MDTFCEGRNPWHQIRHLAKRRALLQEAPQSLFALPSWEKGTKVEQRTGQESHKQLANKLFIKAKNTVWALVSKTLARIDIKCFLTNITGVAWRREGVFQQRSRVFHNSLFIYGVVAVVWSHGKHNGRLYGSKDRAASFSAHVQLSLTYESFVTCWTFY